MPDKLIALLNLFLEQNDGRLSKEQRQKEFELLSNEEVQVKKLTEKYF